jgi:TonB family protein
MARIDTWDEPFLPWVQSANDRRFNRLLIYFLLIFGIISIVVPFLPTPEVVKKDIKSLPPHLARLIIEQRKQLPPPAQVTKKIAKKVTQKKKLTKKDPQTKQDIVNKAASSGLLAMSSELEGLTQNFDLAAFTDTPLKKSTQIEKQVFNKNILTANAIGDNDGIKTSALNRSTGGNKLTSRSTTQVKSTLGKTSPTTTLSNRHGQIIRPEEEIQRVFQKNKGAIFSIYNRALRKDPGLQGKVILELTIAPDGRVIKCRIISSDLNNPALERKIVFRVKLFKFKASGAQQVVIKYPIDFLPS